MEVKKGISEDWLSLWMGLFIFVLGLGVFVGIDLLGWGIKTSVWTTATKSPKTIMGRGSKKGTRPKTTPAT